MHHEIRNRPAFANIHLHLQKGDRIIAEADAMASMSSTIDIHTRLSGGFVRGLLRRAFGGESMFVNEFSTESEGSRGREHDGQHIHSQPWAGRGCFRSGGCRGRCSLPTQ